MKRKNKYESVEELHIFIKHLVHDRTQISVKWKHYYLLKRVTA